MNSRVWAAVLLLLTPGFGAAHARVVTAPAGFELQVDAGKFDEVCLALDAGQAVRYRFQATLPLDNLHWHRDTAVLYGAQQDGATRANARFRAAIAETYCLMWTNRGNAPVKLRGAIEPAQ